MHRIPPRPADTSAEADSVQTDLLREAPVARRLHLAWSLSATVMNAARRAIERSDPRADALERDIQLAEIHFGSAIAAGFREDLERRRARHAARR